MARRKKEAEHVNHERWLVSYADFITLLFAFFTTLYAISTVDQKKAGKLQYSMMTAFNVDFFPSKDGVAGYPPNRAIATVLDGSPKPIGRGAFGEGGDPIMTLTQNLQRLAKKLDLSDRISIKQDDRGVTISLTEAGFFDSGSADLRRDAIMPLEMVADVLEGQRDVFDISVEGHTDNVPVKGGRFASNWDLSTARATTVLSLLLGRELDPAHCAASGYAEYHPVASNDSPEGRRRNRRVDIIARPRGEGRSGQSVAVQPPPTGSSTTAAQLANTKG